MGECQITYGDAFPSFRKKRFWARANDRDVPAYSQEFPIPATKNEVGMFDRLPQPLEIALFAAMALLCAAVVTLAPRHDSAMFFAAIPLYFVCAVMGLRHHERRRRVADEIAGASEEAVVGD